MFSLIWDFVKDYIISGEPETFEYYLSILLAFAGTLAFYKAIFTGFYNLIAGTIRVWR